jgi:uncharacterized damage-inducible protein DinB
MSDKSRLVQQLEAARKRFATTTSVFTAEDATFAPDPALYTVANHIAHAADSLEWFMAGAFGDGWDLDFEASIATARAVDSLGEAQAWLARSFDAAIETVGAASDADLAAPISDTRIMGGAPRASVIHEIGDHTAHHRGSLAVYARLLGKAPPMVYS